MKTRSWLALALTGGVALAGAAGTASFASTPPTTPSSAAGSAPASAETVQLSLLDNSIKGGKNEASATWLEDEVIPAFEQDDDAVLDDLVSSVEYWRDALARRGVLAD